MSKGIVISHPTITKGKLFMAVVDENKYGVGHGKWIDDVNKTGETLKKDDTVEFIITSKTECEIIKKYTASQGIVTESNFKVKITSLESDHFGVKVGDTITFDSYPDEKDQYPGPPPCKQGDSIEVMITSEVGSVFVKVLKQA